ncbi:MAG: metallophosphoesterase [Firmicutes bacterium]|nr:metallophosphoesterase [Bacillota bacterium]
MQQTTKKSKNKSRKRRILTIIGTSILTFILVLIILLIIYGDNRTLDFEFFTIYSQNTNSSQSQKPITIIHLSDMHFGTLRVDVDDLLYKIEKQNPDIIAITGDIVGTNCNIKTSGVFDFIEDIVKIAPTFIVEGNHELSNRNTINLFTGMTDRGAVLLQDRAYTKNIRGKYITIIGLRYRSNRDLNVFKPLNLHCNDNDNFVLTLTHIPTLYNEIYSIKKTRIIPNLVLAGHNHGGQVRIFNRGIFCPDTLFFPRYISGLYISTEIENSYMILSRGIGNSTIPLRVNNRPHVPIIKIY